MKPLLWWLGLLLAGPLFGQLHFARDQSVEVGKVFAAKLAPLGVTPDEVPALGINLIWSGDGKAQIVSREMTSRTLVSVLARSQPGDQAPRARFSVEARVSAPGQAVLILTYELIGRQQQLLDKSQLAWKVAFQSKPEQLEEPTAENLTPRSGTSHVG